MPIRVPDLDDLSWEALVAEARSLIPQFAPEWTNHNAADPGVTLVELFAQISEMLLYRLDRVTDDSARAFCRLVAGGDACDGAPDLTAARGAMLDHLRRLRRAVTREDFERLARSGDVARAKCIPRCDAGDGGPDRDFDAPGHVTVVVLHRTDDLPSPGWLEAIRERLEPARLLTTRLHVVAPRWVTVRVRIALSIDDAAPAHVVRGEAVRRLRDGLDGRRGGADGKGWPFGRDVRVADVRQALVAIPGVVDVRRPVRGPGPPGYELLVAAGESWRVKRDPSGRLERIELRPDELVDASVSEEDVTITGEDGDRPKRE